MRFHKAIEVIAFLIVAVLVAACTVQQPTAPTPAPAAPQAPAAAQPPAPLPPSQQPAAPTPAQTEEKNKEQAIAVAEQYIQYARDKNGSMMLSLVTKANYEATKKGFSSLTDAQFEEAYQDNIVGRTSFLKNVDFAKREITANAAGDITINFGEGSKVEMVLKIEGGKYRIDKVRSYSTLQWGEGTVA